MYLLLCKKKNLKASHELPLLLAAVRAHVMDTYQPYNTELCKRHLEINEQGSNLFNLLFDDGISVVFRF